MGMHILYIFVESALRRKFYILQESFGGHSERSNWKLCGGCNANKYIQVSSSQTPDT